MRTIRRTLSLGISTQDSARCSRRDFLRMVPVVAAGVVGGAASAKAAFAQMMPGGGSRPSTIDPPPGSPFQDPTVLELDRSTPGVAEGWLTVAATTTAIAGRQARLLTYNGVFPGPTISVTKGEKLRLHVSNDLPTNGVNRLGFARGVTNVHTHGWHVSPEDPMDNSHRHIDPAETWTYQFNLRRLKLGSLGWYHPHVHGLVAEQLWSGLAGVLAVNDPNQSLDAYETHVLLLKDIAFDGDEPSAYSASDFTMGNEGDTVMVNGAVNPVLSMRPGQVQRWRIVNASNARFYKLSLDAHVLHVVGVDGGLLDKPYAQSTFLLSPGERVDLLVKASAEAGVYKLLSLPYTRIGMMMGSGGLNPQQVTLLTLDVSGVPVDDALPAFVRLRARRLTPDLSTLPRRTLTLGMSMARGTINGYDYDSTPYTITSTLPDRGPAFEIWTIRNPTGMDHPWHQHVNGAQILSIQGGDAAYRTFHATAPGWKDTVIVPRGGSVTQLVRLQNWRGTTMFHCHIVEHEDIGMMGEWTIE
jgi:FtsP/CotA-like multicopper oxidase with cupredoxin domain